MQISLSYFLFKESKLYSGCAGSSGAKMERDETITLPECKFFCILFYKRK